MRLYRAALRLCPASFRAEYGEELCAVVAARRRMARGPIAVMGVWGRAFGDLFATAMRTHLDLLNQDVRHTWRSLSRVPGFALTAILVAAFGIGAATVAFSLADHVLVRPLPFPQADRLVLLWQDQSYRGAARLQYSPENFRDVARMSTSYASIAAYTTISANLIGPSGPERLDGVRTTVPLFDALRVRPALGRGFNEADGRTGAASVVLLSDGLWRAQFGADPGVIGRTVILSDAPHVVIGVMPRGFYFPSRDVEFWTQTRFDGQSDDDRTNIYLNVTARLKDDVTLQQANAELRVIAARLERDFPKENAKTGGLVVSLRDQIGQQSRLLLVALVGASLCVLLIACTNLANLLLARSLARRHEVSVRAALGAGRERLVRQMLTESFMLAALGGLLGIVVAVVATPLAARLVPTALPIAETPGLDLRMLVLAALLTFATGIGFGVFPALRATRRGMVQNLRDDARAGASRHTERVRAVLVVAEVVASVVLLIGAGLLIRAMWRVQDVDPGFRAAGVLTMRTQLPLPKYADTGKRVQFYRRVVDEIEALPGVSSAAYTSGLPMVMRGGIWPISDRPTEDPAESRVVSFRFVTPRFFATAGIPLRAGRDVEETDTNDRPNVAIVSESFVRQYVPRGKEAIGWRFLAAFRERTIVGVVGDVRVRGLERQSEPQVYVPAAQSADGGMPFYMPKDLVVKAGSSAASLVPAIREILARADPEQPVSNVRLLADIVDSETAPRLVQVRVLGAFAAIAVVLAGVGIHGLLSFSVAQRGREIAVRMALGATRRDIVRLVGARALALGAAGAAIGGACAWPAAVALNALLAGIDPTDALTFGVAMTVAVVMVASGSLLPMRRATRVNPTSAMRTD
jgi:predicted permease